MLEIFLLLLLSIQWRTRFLLLPFDKAQKLNGKHLFHSFAPFVCSSLQNYSKCQNDDNSTLCLYYTHRHTPKPKKATEIDCNKIVGFCWNCSICMADTYEKTKDAFTMGMSLISEAWIVGFFSWVLGHRPMLSHRKEKRAADKTEKRAVGAVKIKTSIAWQVTTLPSYFAPSAFLLLYLTHNSQLSSLFFCYFPPSPRS